ncbi:MAG: YjbH domain-containing protein, partial [Pseudomonadota bacterium]
LASGLYLSGAVTDILATSISDSGRGANSVLPHVRSDSILYDTQANPDIETLTMAYFTGLAPDLYGRVTFGYLERGFAGVSAEMLYRPTGKPWALGLEANSVAQRNTDGLLGFSQYDYSVATGHVSGYVDLGRGYHAQVDMGRYLAGDVGATLSLTREFENGWSVGAFATKTDVSAEDFGEGSFDKGITLQIPLAWFYAKPTRSSTGVTIRPIGRDGGAKLVVADRLYSVLRSYDQRKIDAQWGRVWK